MKGILDEFRKYKYLLVLSVSSALFVVAMQTLVGIYLSRGNDEAPETYLESAVGEIIPLSKETQSAQIVSTLSTDQLKEFNDRGQVEDDRIVRDISSTAINMEKLLVSLDSQSKLTEKSDEVDAIHIQHDIYTNISLCPMESGIQKSCEGYLVDKSGRSIPVSMRMTDTRSKTSSVITIQKLSETDSLFGVFTAKPVQLGITIM